MQFRYNWQDVRNTKDVAKPEWIGFHLAYPRGLRRQRLLVDTAALVSGGYGRFLPAW